MHSVVRAGSSLLIAGLGVAVLAGCGSGKSGNPVAESSGVAAPATSTTTSTTVVPAACRNPTVDTPFAEEMKTALAAVALPAGACITSVGPITKHGEPDKPTFLVSLRVPTAAGPDDLRPVATDIAHAWKGSRLGPETSELQVTNWGYSEAKYMDYLTDRDFHNHPWDGTPSREAELALWVATAQG